jgi:DnaJ-domain-containing protein 1
MVDCFALLEQPRRPWLDPDSLKQHFLAASAAVHPDRVHQASEAVKKKAQAQYTELNAAYNQLREPRDRLRHLLELELGQRPADVQQIPPQLANLFLEISRLSQEADKLAKDQAAFTSPLLRVQYFPRAQEMIAKLTVLQQQLSTHTNQLLAELKHIDSAWVANDAAARRALLVRLEELYPLFGYFGRWSAQIQERINRLFF